MVATEQAGGIDILNCHLGDLKVEFDKDDLAEIEKAKQTIETLLKRGFVLMVQVDGKTKRVKRFDKKHNCYIVEEMPKEPADAGSRKPKQRRVPARSTRATAIAPRAGG